MSVDRSVEERLKLARANRESVRNGDSNGVDGSGGGPHNPDMESRIIALEADMRAVRSTLDQQSGMLPHLATKAGVVELKGLVDALTERLHAHGETLSRLEGLLTSLGTKVDSKLIGGGQMFTIFGGLFALIVTVLGTAVAVMRTFHLIN